MASIYHGRPARADAIATAAAPVVLAQPRARISDGLVVVASTFVLAFGAVAALATELLATAGSLYPGLPAIVGDVKAVAGSEHGLVVVTPRALLVLDRMGHRLRTWSSSASPGPSRRAQTRAQEEASWSSLSLPAEVDWARGYDLEEIDDPDDPRLADGGTGVDPDSVSGHGPRRSSDKVGDNASGTSRSGEGAERVALATAGGRSGWVGGAAGLWEIDLESGAVQRRLVGSSHGVQAVAASANGNMVAVAQGSDLYRSKDGGRTFELLTRELLTRELLTGELLTGAHAPGRAVLAVMDGGAILVLDPGSGTVRVAGSGPAGSGAGAALPVEGATDLAACGQGAIILGTTGVYVTRPVDGGSPAAGSVMVERVADAPPGATRIACGSTGTPWLVGGQALLLADCHERIWKPARAVSGKITAIALTGATPWVATAAGLWAASLTSTSWAGPGEEAEGFGKSSSGRQAAVGDETFTRISARTSMRSFPRAAWWDSLLPRVDAVVASARLATRRDWRAVIVLTFRLGRTKPPSFTTAQRRSAPAQASGGARPPVGSGALARMVSRAGEDDPISVDEKAAVTRILEETSP
ncbi:MAG: hypothetical protein ABI560_08825 [Myxococcales bacterium]